MRRPSITLKLATSLDGKIALSNGQSEWITGEGARAAGRKLRAEHDAICIGSGTAEADNPQLTTRIDGQPNPVRVIFDSSAKLSAASNLAQTARDVPVLLFCTQDAAERRSDLNDLGVILLPIDRDTNGLNVSRALGVLHARSIRTLLIEGGGRLAASFVKAGIVDRIEWFRAPTLLGGDGRDAIAALGLEFMHQRHDFVRIHVTEIGDDLHESYERKS